MSIVGHPKVTERAYEQDRDTKELAVRFATAAVWNGLGKDSALLPQKAIDRLILQIERDYLASLLPSTPSRTGAD